MFKVREDESMKETTEAEKLTNLHRKQEVEAPNREEDGE
jgi:hypothetical protein